MYINKKSPIPAYYQLRNIILKKIEDGEFQADCPIPSERDLSSMLNISRMTVRQALNLLVSEGALYRQKGKGTFVSRVKFEQRNIMSFSDLVRQKGMTPSTKVLKFSKEKAGPIIAGIIGLKEEEMIYILKRLRMANDIPVGIEEVFIPEKFCPGLEQYDLTSSLYRLVKEKYLHVISYVDNVIEASKPAKQEKELLEIQGQVPLLRISSIYYVESGMKLFYENSVYRSDEYKYNVRVYVNRDME